MIGLGHALSHSLAPRGPGGFVGALDTLISQGAVAKAAYSVRKLRAEYAGQCSKLRGNGTGTPEADIPFRGGAQDKSAVAALIANGGGSTAYWKTWYDQSGNGADATQNTEENQVNYSEARFGTGGVGGAAQANCWLDSIDGSLLTSPFAIWVVCSGGTSGSVPLRQLVMFGSYGTYKTASSLRRMSQYWGMPINASNTSIASAKVTFLAVSNGADSTLWLNGTLRITGDAGSEAPSGTMKIGAGDYLPTNNWAESAGATITEVVVFSGDPTTLPGWGAFAAGAKTYFGTV